jgi:hypothetical protein
MRGEGAAGISEDTIRVGREGDLKGGNFISNYGAGIAQWYSTRLRAGCSGVRVPAGAGNFSLHRHVRTGSGAHPASPPISTRSSFPGGKAAGA